jgi:hypothetical protein
MPEPTLKRANAIRYCFDDPDLDFMFQWAAGAAKTGGLDPGELFYIASGMDGTAASWVDRFDEFGDTQRELAADWIGRGQRRSAGEVLMKAYSCYRMAWQLVGQGERFITLIDKYESAGIHAGRVRAAA